MFPQNGKTEHMIRTINDVIRSLLFHAFLLARYWAENLHADTYLLNLLSTKAISAHSSNFAIFSTTPSYAHLQIFGCACYLNTSTTAPHKLAPHSCRCVFLVYSFEHKGYRCLDLTMNHLLVSRHVVLDESSFLFASYSTHPDDLDSLFSSSLIVRPIAPPYPSSITGTSKPDAAPRAAPVPPPVPHAALMSSSVPHVAPAPQTMPHVASASRFTEPPPPPRYTSDDI
jgi:hypothetical protein